MNEEEMRKASEELAPQFGITYLGANSGLSGAGRTYWSDKAEAAWLAWQAATRAAQQWRPIETAPKDGTYIMLANHHGVWIGHYAPVADSGYVFDQPWRSVMLNHWHIKKKSSEQYAPPTHWMPLPAAPEAKV
jgi:hypothetical protein